jgi:hypothetical protein
VTDFIARDPAHFARRLLRFLFTNDELSDSLLPDRPSETRKHYSKKPLDQTRYEVLHRMSIVSTRGCLILFFAGALRSKYCINGSRYDEFYEKCVRRSLIDLMQSCRRKQRARRVTLPPADDVRINNHRTSPLLAPVFSPMLNLMTQLPSDCF